MAVATEPTPPAAPVTKTGPVSGVKLWLSSAIMANIAAKPAVPTAIACFVVNPSGSGTR